MRPDPRNVALLLLEERDSDTSFWRWIKPGQPLSAKEANKFLLGSILDYQMQAEVVWENARRLTEDILGDPDELWHVITANTLAEWNAKKSEYSLHRFPKAHERVYTIGTRVLHQYGGDARNIWNNQSIEAVLYRLGDLRVGKQLSRMVVGALVDAGQLHGKADVKVDTHVCRVLGRILRGDAFGSHEKDAVIDLTRAMNPENPWLLDRPLYRLGKALCSAEAPRCGECYMSASCVFARSAA